MEKKKNKVLIILLSALVGMFALVGIATAFLFNYNAYSPKQVEILDDGNNVYVAVDMNDNYNSYRFKFKDSSNHEIIIDSQKNVLDLTTLLEKGIEIGETYSISSCYLSKNSGNNSEYSKPVEWKVYTYLSSPVIEYVEEQDYIQWNEIENADYYEIYYNSSNEYTSVQTENCYFDLQTIEGGEREFYVVAKSNDESYKDSNKSDVISRSVVHYYKTFTKIEFTLSSKVLTIYGEEDLKKINIYIGETVHETNVESTFNEEQDCYIYSVDITTIYKEGEKIGASPMTTDSYNLFIGEISYIEN